MTPCAVRAVLFAIALSAVIGSRASGYEESTHAAINERAATLSTLDSVLRDVLEMGAGRFTRVDGRSLVDWIKEGSIREDSGLRILNHFHNPLSEDWSQAGLLGVGQSSILWGQNATLSGWSWQDVRQHYFDALTKSGKADRDESLARTFESLGRQIHLIQDAASPPHTKNDPHLFGYHYEKAIEVFRRSEPATFAGWLAGSPDTPNAPAVGWRLLDANPSAPIPVARLFDADLYGGANPGVTTDALIGLAEYTNANFFSEDRIFTENEINPQKRFPYPRRSSVGPPSSPVTITLANGNTVQRRYYVKERDGAVGYRLAAVPYLRGVFDQFNLDSGLFRHAPTLDGMVYRDYAERLIPRAVSYSTAMLDYFVRGEVSASGDNLSTSFGNATEGEGLQGTLGLYYDDANDVRRGVPQASWSVTLGPSGAVGDLRFPPPTDPVPKVPDKYTLVFRGRLGGEVDAVAGAEVYIPSVVIVHLVKRSDGTPYQRTLAQTIDVNTQEVLGAGTTDHDGKVRLTWRPGRTALVVPTRSTPPVVNRFPIYWAGGESFAAELAGARIIRANDVDAQGVLRVAIPLIATEWPERVSACTGFPLLSIYKPGLQESTFLGPDRIEIAMAAYLLHRATLTRNDPQEEIPLYSGEPTVSPNHPDQYLVAADTNRIGQIIGMLEWDSEASHQRVIYAVDEGGALGDPVEYLCGEYLIEVEEAAVTIVER